MLVLYKYDIITSVFTPLGGPTHSLEELCSRDAGVLRPWFPQPGTFVFCISRRNPQAASLSGSGAARPGTDSSKRSNIACISATVGML